MRVGSSEVPPIYLSELSRVHPETVDPYSTCIWIPPQRPTEFVPDSPANVSENHITTGFVSPLSASGLNTGAVIPAIPPPQSPFATANHYPAHVTSTPTTRHIIRDQAYDQNPVPPLPTAQNIIGDPVPVSYFANADGGVSLSGGDEEAWQQQQRGDDTSEELKEEGIRELLLSLQKQVSIMSSNLSAKIDEIQCLQHGDSNSALHAIRTHLYDLTKSVENCQTEVVEVKKDIVEIKQEIDHLQAAKEEIEELRNAVEQLEEQHRKRRMRLVHHQGLTCFLCYAIFAAVLGMFQFGYNSGVINTPQSVIKDFIKECLKQKKYDDNSAPDHDIILAVVVSIFAIGGMIGGFSGGYVGNKFGRKRGLLFNNILAIGGACMMGFAKLSMSYELLILGRFVIGINCGLNTSLVPMYISEIAPITLRGGLGTVNQLAVTVGLLLSQVLGLKSLLGNENAWSVLLGLAIVPAIMQVVLLPVCPESPRYLLISCQREEEARRALRRLRASTQVDDDMIEMKAEETANQSEVQITMLQLLRSRALRMPLAIGIVMQLSQQLSGVNAVLYYSTALFVDTGISEELARIATLGVGAVMVAMTLVSIPLMDRKGRRSLHLTGLGGMFIFSIFITISFLIREMVDILKYIAVLSTLCFIIFFAIGPGSIPWMITAELFSQGPRPAAMSIAVLINWLANFCVGIAFPYMQKTLDNYTFLPFSCLLAIFWLFTYYKVPETKNKTFEEISAIFQRGSESGLPKCPKFLRCCSSSNSSTYELNNPSDNYTKDNEGNDLGNERSNGVNSESNITKNSVN